MSRSLSSRLVSTAIAFSTLVSFVPLSSDRAAAAIIDPGFETSGVPDWTLFNGAGFNTQVTYASHPGLPSTGRGLEAIRSYWQPQNSGGVTTVSQILSDTIAANTQYVLSVDVGSYFRFLPDVIDIRVLDSTNTELPIISFVNPTPGNPPTDSVYAQWVKTYQTGASVNAGALQVVLFAQATLSSGDRFVAFDNVGLSITAVPEPTSFVLAATAMAGLSIVRRRRRS